MQRNSIKQMRMKKLTKIHELQLAQKNIGFMN